MVLKLMRTMHKVLDSLRDVEEVRICTSTYIHREADWVREPGRTPLLDPSVGTTTTELRSVGIFNGVASSPSLRISRSSEDIQSKFDD